MLSVQQVNQLSHDSMTGKITGPQFAALVRQAKEAAVAYELLEEHQHVHGKANLDTMDSGTAWRMRRDQFIERMQA